MKKNIIIFSGIFLFISSMLFIAQAIRWNHLSNPKIRISKSGTGSCSCQYMDINELKKKDPKGTYDPNKVYFNVYTIQQTFVRGSFPFVETKVDTLNTELSSKSI